MDKFALIGSPVSHSLSPALFDTAYGGRWPYELVDDPDFERCWGRFLAEYRGINVTAPFKESVMPLVDIVHPECLAIGAANIVTKTERGLEAFNSDHLAVRSILEEECPRGGRAVIAGFGGAGRAAAAAATDCGMEVIICNRSTSKAAGIRPVSELPMLAETADVMIYTLPCGIPCLERLSCRLVLEANYLNPALEAHKGIGRYISGKEWLFRQALLGYRQLTGEEPDADALKSCISGLR